MNRLNINYGVFSKFGILLIFITVFELNFYLYNKRFAKVPKFKNVTNLKIVINRSTYSEVK